MGQDKASITRATRADSAMETHGAATSVKSDSGSCHMLEAPGDANHSQLLGLHVAAVEGLNERAGEATSQCTGAMRGISEASLRERVEAGKPETASGGGDAKRGGT